MRVIIGVAAVLAGAVGALLHAVNSAAGRSMDTSFWVLLAVAAVAFGSVGTLLAGRSRVQRVPGLMIATGFGQGLTLLLLEYVAFGPVPFEAAALWVSSWLWAPSLFLSATVLPLLLPEGELPSPRWRPALWFGWTVLALQALVWAVTPYEAQAPPVAVRDLRNPVGLAAAGHPALQVVLALATLVAAALGLASLVVRWRRADGVTRQQLKWLAVGAAAAIVIFATGVFLPQPWGELLVGLAALPVPLAAGVAALRHRLWDVDLAISTGLRYLALSVVAAGIYTAVVTGLGATTGAPAIATLIVALVLLPLHDLLRRGVNRLVHGELDDPATALAVLGTRLESTANPAEVADQLLPTMVTRLAVLLRSPYVGVELADGTVVRHGEPDGHPEQLSLRYAGRQVGVLELSGRARSSAERSRLERVAGQAAVAAHSVLLTREARRARQLVVAAREEERRRLRWDLHDGLAPMLAGIALQAETARDLVRTRPEEAERILGTIVPNLSGAVADVRAIVHELRPPALDDLGLAGAVTELATRFDRPERRVTATVGQLDGLPAAVDLAAYRIVAEALNNAVRHAAAASIGINLERVGSRLEVRVADDGCGLPSELTEGVGLTSMRARAEELGGRLSVASIPGGGTTVTATLPLAMGEDEL